MRITSGGRETRDVHATTENLDVPKPRRGQLRLQCTGGKQGQIRTVMEMAQRPGDVPGQESEPIMLAVLMELGVKAGHRGDVQGARGREYRMAKRPLGGDIYKSYLRFSLRTLA